jgi:hypothetical protein
LVAHRAVCLRRRVRLSEQLEALGSWVCRQSGGVGAVRARDIRPHCRACVKSRHKKTLDLTAVLSRCHLPRPQSSWAEVQDGATGGRTVGDHCGAEFRPVGFDRWTRWKFCLLDNHLRHVTSTRYCKATGCVAVYCLQRADPAMPVCITDGRDGGYGRPQSIRVV